MLRTRDRTLLLESLRPPPGYRIRRAIGALPLQQRVVVVFYYINDLSLQEIAEILEVPVGTVKSRLHYGRKSLKLMLGPQGEEILSEARYEFT